MRIVKIILLAVAAIIVLFGAAFIAAGLLIPAERSFANEVEINAPAETVWQVINDRAKYTEWQTGLDHVEIIDDQHWIEHTKGGAGPLAFSVAKDERPARMEFTYLIGDSFFGEWKGEVTPTTTGVQLNTEDAYSANGWMSKIMVYIFFDMDKFAKDWNQQLKRRAESLGQ